MCISVWEYNWAQSGDTEKYMWPSLHMVTAKKKELFIYSQRYITRSNLAVPFVTTGQLSSPSGGLGNMVCNLIVVIDQCTGKDSSHHKKHLCFRYELAFLWAVLHEESLDSSVWHRNTYPHTSTKLGLELSGREKRKTHSSPELHCRWWGRFFHNLVLPS